MSIALTKFEKELLDKLLEGEDTVLSLLREHLRNATVRSRKQSHVGFYVVFDIPELLPRITDKVSSAKSSFCFGDVDATINGSRSRAGFLIWVKDGYLQQLEGYTYGEEWPLELTDYVLSYRDGSRNIDALRQVWLVV